VPPRMQSFPNGEIGIVWEDGHESYYPAHALRCACNCASCVEEMTGRALLDPARVPRDVVARSFHPVGRYGVAIVWSDGHDTGIYSFQRLRQMCTCGECG